MSFGRGYGVGVGDHYYPVSAAPGAGEPLTDETGEPLTDETGEPLTDSTGWLLPLTFWLSFLGSTSVLVALSTL